MKRFTLIVLFLLVSFLGMAVDKTTNNVTGNWTTASTWTDGVAPPITNIPSTNVDYVINGTITVGAYGSPVSMTFKNVNNAYDFTVNGTLIIYGDLTFDNKAMNLIIPNGGLVIVLGNLSSTNKITLSNGGTFVVTGTATFSGAQSDYIDTGGKFWPIGGTSGDADATSASAASGSFSSNAPQYIKDFVGSNGLNTLPVELLFFRGNEVNGKVNLSWATSTELNFDFFDVERSSDMKEFRSIGQARGHGTTKEKHEYSLQDEKPLIGRSYYRLKSVDFDGFTEYFKVIVVDFLATKSFEISPNPTDGASLGFSLNFLPDNNTTIIVYDNVANVVGSFTPTDNSQAVIFPNSLKSGMYYAKILAGDFVKVQRFVVK